MLTSEEEGLAILVICDNVTIECPREQETERERRETETESERVRAVRREREKAREKEMCNINIFSVLLCPFLIFLFSLLYLSHLLEKRKL